MKEFLNLVKTRDLNLVREFYNAHKDVINSNRINTALRLAVENGDYNMTKYLVEELKADINNISETPICWAAYKGHLDIVEYLHNKGGDIHICDELALRWAALNGNLDVVKYLVKNGANIHTKRCVQKKF